MNAPIGIIDSGFGGLSIYKSILALLPHESCIYVGDHAHAPYGSKTPEYIQNQMRKIISFLLARGVKLIVIACNTATVAGIDLYRQWFPHIPLVGVVPVIKTAANLTKKKKFAVLSTDTTANSAYQKNLIAEFAGGCSVYNLACPTLVELVEDGKVNTLEARAELEKILTPDLIQRIDVIVLGCTHFPFLHSVIRDIVGEGVAVLESGGAVARQVQRILSHNELLATGKSNQDIFYSTGNQKALSNTASLLLEKAIHVDYANI